MGPSSVLLALLTACGGERHEAPVAFEERPAASREGPAPRLLRQSHLSTATGKERDYYLYLPAGYDETSDTRWPVLLFLHGGGERGNGKDELDWVLALGPLYEAWIQKRDLPFLIVAPQLPMFGRDEIDDYLKNRDPNRVPRLLERGVPARPKLRRQRAPMTGAVADPDLPYGPTGLPDGWPRYEKDVLRILDHTLAERKADPVRVYLTGVSYGGFGAWHLASGHPERFAALLPVLAWGHPALMPALAARPMPLWVFAGGRDRVVPLRYFYTGLNALERAGHREVRFTVHEDLGHQAWARVYASEDVYHWLLSQRRPS